MSETESSGAATTAAETASTPNTSPNPTPPSTFSNTRGSGLARGKRPVSPPAQAASGSPAADYKPTAVSVITAPAEYKNPFAPPAPAAAVAPVETNAPTPSPASIAAAPTPEAPGGPAAPAAEIRLTESEPVRDLDSGSGPTAAEADTKPAELKILPPEAPKHVERHWESDSFRNVTGQPGGGQVRPADAPPAGQRREDRRGERPYFRSERERRNERPREGRPAWGESGRDSGDQAGRTEFPAPPPAEEPRKGGGLFGWVKKFFGGGSGASAETAKSGADSGGDRGYGHDGHHHRRRRGHGHQFHGDQRGPRDGPPSGDGRGYGGEHRHRGGRRHRRGGGGGYRGGGGDYRGGSRPEGGPPAGS